MNFISLKVFGTTLLACALITAAAGVPVSAKGVSPEQRASIIKPNYVEIGAALVAATQGKAALEVLDGPHADKQRAVNNKVLDAIGRKASNASRKARGDMFATLNDPMTLAMGGFAQPKTIVVVCDDLGCVGYGSFIECHNGFCERWLIMCDHNGCVDWRMMD